MAPKALTDCPENLREAIDWLIQVNHGGGISQLFEALGKLFDNVVQDAQKSLSSFPESAEPSARDVIDKLQTFRSSFPKDSANSNKNILHNVCSAFEKFLGYQPPGTYDGSGIVYGDASRLCDAIVAFLYRVFSDVRDNQPYVVGRALLGGLVGDLKKARRSGHHGFKAVVPKVASGLRDYNSAVKASNERVKRPIEELLDYLNPGGELLKRVNGLQVETPTEQDVEKADQLVEGCVKQGEQFVASVVGVRGNVKDLNANLRDKVGNAKKTIYHEYRRLMTLTRKQKENYNSMIKIIKKALEKARKMLKHDITERVTALVDGVRRRVQKILDDLRSINKKLSTYVSELDLWIKEAEQFIQSAQQYVQKILDEVNEGSQTNYLGQLKSTLEQIEIQLGVQVGSLEAWIADAIKALEAASSRATEVSGKLNPQSDKDPIGTNITKIDTATKGIVAANSQLGDQLRKLNSWIDSAEKIRAKAKRRAEEAYDKLQVHKTLSRKIGEIEAANSKIRSVHSGLSNVDTNLGVWKDAAQKVLQEVIDSSTQVKEKLNPEKNSGHDIGKKIGEITEAREALDQAKDKLHGHLGSLSDWKQQAATVIGEAVSKAENVWKALDENNKAEEKSLGKNIENIDTAQKAIDSANKTLGEEVGHLNNWHTAADKIVQAGQNKCDEILTKTEIKNGDPVIKQQAAALQKKATDLLEAYKETFTKVSALDGQVRGAVEDLEKGMKDDLDRLQKDIVSKMKKHVGEMLLQIKGQVGEIKGSDTSIWNNPGASGLLGIAEGVRNYATAFRHDNFAEIAKGWLEATILRYNGTVRRILNMKQEFDENSEKGNISAFAIGMKDRLKTDVIGIAKDAFQNVNTVSGTIQDNINAVKTACEIFANGLDKELMEGSRGIVNHVKEKALPLGQLVAKIQKCVCECDVPCTKCRNGDCGKKAAAELIMCALTSTVRQVGNELESVFLQKRVGNYVPGNSKSIAGELDKVVGETKKLDIDLGDAANTALDRGSGAHSPGQTNTILTSVKGIAEQVKNAMKDTDPKGINVETTMEQYKIKKNNPPDELTGKYQQLIQKDITTAMDDFKKLPAFADNKEQTGLQDELSNGNVSTATTAVQGHLNKITQELQAIAKCVEDKSAKTSSPDEYGIKQRLSDLGTMLKEGEVNLKGKVDGIPKDTVKGLNAIHNKIHQLQTTEFTNHPKSIEEALPKIKLELKSLRDLLKKDPNGRTENGVIDDLTDLKETGLGSAQWHGKDVNYQPLNGLMKIHEDIKGLKESEFTEKPKNINQAVNQITTALEGLQTNLQDDIIDWLRGLKDSGLESGGNWTVDGKVAEGIESIKRELEKENDILARQPVIIERALDKIHDELQMIGYRLNDDSTNSDVVDHLTRLKEKIGKDVPQSGNLQGIHTVITGLQKKQFTDNPEAIEAAKAAITGELTRLQGVLSDDVIKALGDLVTNGLSDSASWRSTVGLERVMNEVAMVRNVDVSDVRSILNHLCYNVAEDGRGLKRKLQGFEDDDVKMQLVKIKENLNAVNDKLSAAIRELEKLLTFLEHGGRQLKAQLHRAVDEEVDDALKQLSEELRRQYVSNIHDMLSHFASAVAEDLKPLPREIRKDMEMGFKGFMSKLENKFVKNVVNIRDVSRVSSAQGKSPKPKSPLTHAARILRTAFAYFFLNLKTQADFAPDSRKIAPTTAALTKLLSGLQASGHFGYEFCNNLYALRNEIDSFAPAKFGDGDSPLLLNVLRAGFPALVDELGRAYISRYDGAFDDCVLFHAAKKTHTPEAAKCVMILLTVTDTLFRAVNKLRMGCTDEWAHHNINAYNPLGQFLGRCGFVVASDGLIHAELRNENACNGAEICSLIHDALDPLDALHDMLKYYLRVCHLHIPTEPRYPCTVRDVLAWLAGLPHTAVYKRIQPHCHNLSGGETDDVLKYSLLCIPGALGFLTHHSSTLLVTICGNGRGFDHADYQYACNFWDNSRGFHYPSDVAELLDILARLCKRALRALNFLRARCRYEASMGHGWSECRYGRSVPAANWQCNDHSSIESNCRPNCQPKSPLQAHLMDQLPGLLPHKLTSVGCDSECLTCPTGKPGQQCVTPMGFWDLPRAGSRTGTGRDIFAVLTALCSNAESPLPSLLRCLSSINPCPPQTLGDMFAFFCNFAQRRGLDHRTQRLKYLDNNDFISHLTSEAIPSVSMNLCARKQAVRLTSALTALYHSPADHAAAAQADADTDKNANTDSHSDLSSLTVRAQCSDSLTCAPYLQPLSFHACHTLPEQHAHLYLSWVVHLAWQFWYLLEQLLNAFQDIDCASSGCSECPCKPGQHGVNLNCKCKALLSCHGVLPTFHAYGFTKYCHHFCTQLQNVLHSRHFTELFHQIDEFLYGIRAPFLFTIVTLWLTATIYILHSLLYRMDVLRIRSHLLTTRASHLIDVKALLAGSRRMLSLYKDVDYFDDDPMGQLDISN
ncbi:Extracellular matrix-binding ebh, putative [Babesia ovata]|uniref:Extracellular matrix-binding ebh, putative n=1 Tax=Babesia ovata TaxID=189622 RepID=A0A2H6K7H1_9APIC|nr:Extracellular matrix-binding ebh, putative [Babesia ovata]GBE58940.1 Extracellular matrix-binding ebh, putative [Babesia ovata]